MVLLTQEDLLFMLDTKKPVSKAMRKALLVQEMKRDDSRYIVAWIGGVLMVYLIMAIVAGV